jgi:hypothetical protein
MNYVVKTFINLNVTVVGLVTVPFTGKETAPITGELNRSP